MALQPDLHGKSSRARVTHSLFLRPYTLDAKAWAIAVGRDFMYVFI
jgi:hypothetical protein